MGTELTQAEIQAIRQAEQARRAAESEEARQAEEIKVCDIYAEPQEPVDCRSISEFMEDEGSPAFGG